MGAHELSLVRQSGQVRALWAQTPLLGIAAGLLALCCVVLLTRPSPSAPSGSGSLGRSFRASQIDGVERAAFLHTSAKQAIKVASWNLAGINMTTAADLSQQLLSLDADIILTQEDIEYLPDATEAGIAVPGYRRAGACRGEELWEIMKAHKDGGRWIQNAIYTRDSTIQVVRSFAANLSDTSPNPRCAAFVDFLPADAPLGDQLAFRVASVHLTGGRFVSDRWRQFGGEKPKQVQNVLHWLPDVVGGDLNSYGNANEADELKKTYPPYVDAKTTGEGRAYLGYATGGVEEFERGGMLRVPVVGKTTKYGGTVDHLFVRRSARVAYLDSSWGIVGDLTKSDHNAVVASVEVALAIWPS